MTRALHGFGFAARKEKASDVAQLLTPSKQIAIGLLVVMLLSSAFGVIYLKDLSRRLFIQYQALQSVQQVEESAQNKLLLEKGAWSSPARIQSVATKQLNMVVPSMKQIVMLRG